MIMSNAKQPEKLKKMNDKFDQRIYKRVVEQYFLIPFDSAKTLDIDISNLGISYQDLATNFKNNILGAITTISVPYRMVQESVMQRRFQALHTAERIRTLKSDKYVNEKIAYRVAAKKFQHEIKLSSKEFAKQVVYELNNTLDRKDFILAASEILRQGIILIWSSFEVFVRDFFILFLNLKPQVVETLINSKELANSPIFKKSVTLESLREYHYDVKNQMGDLLLEQFDFSSLPAMKKFFHVLFNQDKELQKSLGSKDLWFLAQRRNLVVHRRSTIDKKYLELTGDNQKLGAVL